MSLRLLPTPGDILSSTLISYSLQWLTLMKGQMCLVL